MNSHVSVTLGIAILAAAGLSACSADKETAAPTSTTPTSSSVSAQAGSTTSVAPATSSTATSSTATSSTATSSTATSSATTVTSSAPMVGGMTECTKEALAQPALAAAQAMGPDNLYTVDQLNCADGWAVTSGVLASTDNPQMGAPTSFVFQQEGQFWVVQDKAKVCGTDPITTTPPADAAIPAALFVPGCAAG
jgi:hypothetical protein